MQIDKAQIGPALTGRRGTHLHFFDTAAILELLTFSMKIKQMYLLIHQSNAQTFQSLGRGVSKKCLVGHHRCR